MSYDIERELIFESNFDPKKDAPDHPELIDLLPVVSMRVWGTSIGTFEIVEIKDDETSIVHISKELFEMMKEYRYVEK